MSRTLAIILAGVNVVITFFYFLILWVSFEFIVMIQEQGSIFAVVGYLFFWVEYLVVFAWIFMVLSMIPLITLPFRQLYLVSIASMYILAALSLVISALPNGALLVIVATVLARNEEKYMGTELPVKESKIEQDNGALLIESPDKESLKPLEPAATAESAAAVKKTRIANYPLYIVLPVVTLTLVVMSLMWNLISLSSVPMEANQLAETKWEIVAEIAAFIATAAGIIIYLKNQLNKSVSMIWYVAALGLFATFHLLTGILLFLAAILLQLDRKKFTRQTMQMKEDHDVERSRINHNRN